METASTDSTPSVSTTLRCVRCGYDLRGQPAEGLCPECGLSVEQTMSVGTHLQRGRPGWLRRLWLGTWILIFVPAAAIAAIPAGFLVADRFRIVAPMQDITFWLLSAAPFLVAVMHFAGVCLLTSREHRYEHQLPGNHVRVALRFSVLGSLVIAACITGMIQQVRSDYWAYAAGASFLLLIPTYILTFVHLRTLARRIGHASLAEHCVIVSIGISAGILMTMFSPYLVEASTVYPMLVMLTTDSLFGIWSTYLLFRFAIVFHQSALVAKRNWIAADAAVAG